MSTFSDMAAEGVGEFLELFGESHEVGGVTLVAIVDTEEGQPETLPDGGAARWQGRGRRVTVCYVPQAAWLAALGVADWKSAVPVGGLLTVDGSPMTVLHAAPEDGLLRLELEAATTGGATTLCTVIHYAAGDGYSAPAESGRENNIPCRYQARAQAVERNGRESTASAEVSFAADSGLVALAVGDAIMLSGQPVLTVLDVLEDRDLAGVLRQRVAVVGR